MAKKIPIVFSFDDNYVLPASIAIQSLIDSKRAGTEYDIFVLYKNLKSQTMRKFEKIANINWLKVGRKYFKKAPHCKEYPEVVYYRLLIHELIPQYDKIIWSDVDVLFKKDLSDIYETDLENNYWGGVAAEVNNQITAPCCKNIVGEEKAICMSGHTRFEENTNEYIFMSGFMLINSKKMRQDNMTMTFFDTIRKFRKRLVMFDLEVLNLACKNVKQVPFDYCVLENIFDEDDAKNAPEYPFLKHIYSDKELLKAKKTPAIIHYTGKNIRIWNRRYKKIPLYYRIYIINSPFYNKEKYFPIEERVKRAYLFIRKMFIPKILKKVKAYFAKKVVEYERIKI